jgi:membrane fusion protein, heavy metal efflux system
VRYENKHYAYIANGKHQFEMQEVQVGDSENGFTEILNAEQFKGKTFVVKGAYQLLMAIKNTSDEE